ncbi:hypothetical protein LZ30DRAFT_464843 [Colletotrichum cereale]|nr:hypothetical protein LZ30DRAFT_464843 [Colletotrichum cereale]
MAWHAWRTDGYGFPPRPLPSLDLSPRRPEYERRWRDEEGERKRQRAAPSGPSGTASASSLCLERGRRFGGCAGRLPRVRALSLSLSPPVFRAVFWTRLVSEPARAPVHYQTLRRTRASGGFYYYLPFFFFFFFFSFSPRALRFDPTVCVSSTCSAYQLFSSSSGRLLFLAGGVVVLYKIAGDGGRTSTIDNCKTIVCATAGGGVAGWTGQDRAHQRQKRDSGERERERERERGRVGPVETSELWEMRCSVRRLGFFSHVPARFETARAELWDGVVWLLGHCISGSTHGGGSLSTT